MKRKTDELPVTRQVKVIGRKGTAVLVEYIDHDKLKRVTLPQLAVDDAGFVAEDELAQGIPYGVPWAEVIQLVATPQQLEIELNMRGIWTAEDALSYPNEIKAAVQAAYGMDVAAVLQAANAIKRGGKSNGG